MACYVWNSEVKPYIGKSFSKLALENRGFAGIRIKLVQDRVKEVSLEFGPFNLEAFPLDKQLV
jgi:hypothetical protein